MPARSPLIPPVPLREARNLRDQLDRLPREQLDTAALSDYLYDLSGLVEQLAESVARLIPPSDEHTKITVRPAMTLTDSSVRQRKEGRPWTEDELRARREGNRK